VRNEQSPSSPLRGMGGGNPTSQQVFQLAGHLELTGPLLEVIEIEIGALDTDHTCRVSELPVGRSNLMLTEFVKNHVLRRGDLGRDGEQRGRDAPGKHLAFKRVRPQQPEVHFQR
jgi:hypothetical protein